MKLVGISGKKRSGKNTIAEYLGRAYGFKEAAYADPLKTAARAIFGLTPAHTDGELKEIVIPRWGLSPRQIMQRLGTEAMRGTFGEDVWIKSLFARIEGEARVVVSDVRFPNEADAVREDGGIVVRVERPGLVSTDDHPSETALDGYEFDVVLLNAGTIGGLYAKVDWLFEKITKEHA
jgi:hypothetical protein